MDTRPTPASGWGEILLGAGVTALGALILVQTTQLRVAASYAKISPKLFPGLIGSGLLVLGVLLTVQAWRSRAEAESGEPDDLVAIGAILGGILAYALLLVPLGFVLASTLLFTAVVTGFGSRSFLRDAAIGLVVAVVAYVVFKHALGLQLPRGVLGTLLG